MSNEYFVKQALKELGITRANRTNAEYQALVDNFIRAEEAAQREGEEPLPVTVASKAATNGGIMELIVTPPARAVPPAPPVFRPVNTPKPRSDGKKRGSSKSTLAAALRGEGVLEKKVRVGKPGRPRIIATWMRDVAATTADGTTLPEALRIHGVELDEMQLRALYRNKAFKEMRIEVRERYLRGGRPSGKETQSTETPLRGIPPESD